MRPAEIFFQFNYQTPTHLLSGDDLHIIASMQKVVNKKIKKIFWKKFKKRVDEIIKVVYYI